MKKIDPTIQNLISQKVLEEAEANDKKHPSGRLSASRLGWPLQWQMLHYYKVPQKPNDEYTLRKFQRGRDVEERIMKWIAPAPDKMQVEVSYRGVIGFADVIMDHPIEVKSVTNRAFKYIQSESESKRGHRLQGMLYAKALKYDTFGIAYVASDDYRVLCTTEQVTEEIDEVIDAYETQVKLGTVPTFEGKEPWQSMEEYNPYPEWQFLGPEDIAEKLRDFTSKITSVNEL